MIFLSCRNEDVIQVNDKTRLDVSNSFVSSEAITDILIKTESTEPFVSVYNANQDKWFLDWAYSTEGEKIISVEATDGINTVSQNFLINVVSVESDNLYSTDSQLYTIESELKKDIYIPLGRNSFISMHREAQSRILQYLDRKRIWNKDGSPYTKDQLNVDSDLSKWSLYETAYLIYSDLFISSGDKFEEKMKQYKALVNYERDRGALRIDRDGNGSIDPGTEIQDTKTYRMIIR